MSFAHPTNEVLRTLSTMEALFSHLRIPAGVQDALHDLLGTAPELDPIELAMLSEDVFGEAVEPFVAYVGSDHALAGWIPLALLAAHRGLRAS